MLPSIPIYFNSTYIAWKTLEISRKSTYEHCDLEKNHQSIFPATVFVVILINDIAINAFTIKCYTIVSYKLFCIVIAYSIGLDYIRL